MPSLALFEPEIPANAGSIARLCAATSTPLHLIGRLGFSFRHPDARRAGMDYWERVELHRHVNFGEFLGAVSGRRIWAFSTKAERSFWTANFQADDILLFGPESRGLPADLLQSFSASSLVIPMVAATRSLNLATSAGIGLYEALRQTHRFDPGR